MRFFRFLIFLGILHLSNITFGQYSILGNASRIQQQCYQLTPDSTIGFGQLFSNRPHNLNRPIVLYNEIYFGENEEGGNGITFFFQTAPRSEMPMDSIYGLEQMPNALAVEFDTHPHSIGQGQNGEPNFDHVSLHKDHNFDHSSANNLQGPIIAGPNGNLEDGAWHDVKISWNPFNQRLIIWLDCEEVINYQDDIISNIFAGNPSVFYGFSAGSSDQFNRQEVCATMTSLSDLLQDVTICQGARTQLNAITRGANYQWTPSVGLSTDYIANPVASPEVSTSYFLEVETGFCDEVLFYNVDVNVENISANVDIGMDTLLCVPETYTLDASTENATSYRWSNGTTDSLLTVNRTARYDVTVTFEDLCVAQDWAHIAFENPPTVLLQDDTTICIESNGFVLNPILDANVAVDHNWNNGSTADSLIINRPGFYQVMVSNVCGEDEASVFVNSVSCRDFYIPNAFTPNNDGFNDEVYPFTKAGDIDQITHFSIYDRWGNMVYMIEYGEPNNRSLGWNGKVKGKEAANGIYMYQLILRFRDGQESLVKGNFTLF